MCRFLLVKFNKDISPKTLLEEFAQMCQESKTEEGDWQGDGWGVAWYGENTWEVRKSLLPIWEERKKFGKVPKTRILVVHARSATFAKHKGNIDYNEPYLSGDYCYVFNGMVQGVRLVAEGQIGAQKVWSLLQKELTTNEPLRALENISEMLRKNSRSIKGLNVALATKDNFFVLFGKQGNGDYFTLRKLLNGDLKIVCSEEIGNFKFEKMREGEVIAL